MYINTELKPENRSNTHKIMSRVQKVTSTQTNSTIKLHPFILVHNDFSAQSDKYIFKFSGIL